LGSEVVLICTNHFDYLVVAGGGGRRRRTYNQVEEVELEVIEHLFLVELKLN
jgi:hypothetical protein